MRPLGAPDDVALSDGEVPEELTVVLGEEEPEDLPGGVVIRFASARHRAQELLVGTHGDGLWRRAPHPAADGLFDLAPPRAARTLVAGGEAGERAEIAAAARARGVEVVEAGRLRVADLEAAATVMLLDADGAFPAGAFAVAAAARLLVLRVPDVTFGLHDGVDCLIAADAEAAVDLLDTAATYAPDFDAVRRSARVTARSQRASDVYARLATDVELGLVGVERK